MDLYGRKLQQFTDMGGYDYSYKMKEDLRLYELYYYVKTAEKKEKK